MAVLSTGLLSTNKLQLDNIYFDATINEDVEKSITLTKQPIEVGANITDYAIIEPIKLSFTVKQSDLAILSLTQDIENILSSATNIPLFRRTIDAVNKLGQLLVDRKMINVICNNGYFPNMVVTKVRENRTIDTSTMMTLTIDLEQLILVGDNIVNSPKAKKLTKKVNSGIRNTTESPS